MPMDVLDAEHDLDRAKTPSDVDDVLADYTPEGAPDYIAKDFWKWVEIEGHGHTLRILVAPDYYALGDHNGVRRIARSTPFGAQAVADAFDAILPSRKLLIDIQKAANPKINYIDVKGNPWRLSLAEIETPKAAQFANDGANTAFGRLDIAPGDGLTIGYKKAIVVGPNLDGSHVAIFGGRYNEGGAIVQPYSTIHDSGYSDYSHGIVLISRKAELDGERVDLRLDVFGSDDPNVVALVSDQGQFDPVFPNAGKKSKPAFSGPRTSFGKMPPKPKGTAPPTEAVSGGSKLGKLALLGGVAGLLWWWLG